VDAVNGRAGNMRNGVSEGKEVARTTRRVLLGGVAAAGVGAMVSHRAAALQVATPAAGEANAPGYAIARVRTLASAELNQAFYPDVMAKFVPKTTALPGFLGYVYAFDDADPASIFTLSTLTDADAALASAEIAQAYVDQLDPRFAIETPLSADGRVRMYATTDRSPAELPPFLHGATITLRNQTNAPGLDLDETIRIATETLIPLFRSLPGFVLYCWFERPEGRIAINIWDTPEDLAAASDALAAWRAEYFATPTASEEVAYNGTIGYATIAGLA
jgi:hypothetical protein